MLLAASSLSVLDVRRRLAPSRWTNSRISASNQFLLRRALAAPRRDGISAVATDIIRRSDGARIPGIAGRAGLLGLRRFERRFVQQVGVTPKLFARIARFEAELDRMALGFRYGRKVQSNRRLCDTKPSGLGTRTPSRKTMRRSAWVVGLDRFRTRLRQHEPSEAQTTRSN